MTTTNSSPAEEADLELTEADISPFMAINQILKEHYEAIDESDL